MRLGANTVLNTVLYSASPTRGAQVKQYASDPDGLKKLMEEYQLPSSK